MEPGAVVDVIILQGTSKGAWCRRVGQAEKISLATGIEKVVPGETWTVKVKKAWRFGGQFLSGDVVGKRIDVGALGLKKLRLEDYGPWDPETNFYREPGGKLPAWAVPIVERGVRTSFEMQVTADRYEWLDRAIDLRDAGDWGGARELLMKLLGKDLRALDAHAHLGNWAFEGKYFDKDAIRHFEVGVRIGEHSLGADFDGVLPWGLIDNRPFLRCLHGYALCLWRMGDFEAAARELERLLWLNPDDNQGARYCLEDVKGGRAWRPD